MDIVVALHAAGALLVLIAGLAKVARPTPTTDLLGSLGLPAHRLVTVGIGLAEALVGVLALAVGGPLTAAATGVIYAAFAIVVVRAMGVGAASCGCFGRVDAPPSWIHVAGNSVFAVVSLAAVAGSTPLEVMDGQPAGGVGFVVLTGVIAGLSLVAFTALPEALDARHGTASARFRLHDTGRR